MLSTLSMLWLPILVSTVVVYIAEMVANMILPFHKKDFAGVPDEDGFREAIRSRGLGQGQYFFPFVDSPEAMKSQEWKDKMTEGPVGKLLIAKNSSSMTGMLIWQLVLDLGIAVVVAYLASAALAPGAEYLEVFQIVGTAALLAYAASHFVYGIWYHFRWRLIWLRAAEGLVYACLVAGIFGWLWPA